MRILTFAAAVTLAILSAGHAAAAIMSATFEGVVRAGSNDATGLFGTADIRLRDDEAFSLTYTYDTALGDPGPFIAGLDRRDGGAASGTVSPVLSVVFTFRGITTDHSQLDDQGLVQTDAFGFHYINVNKSWETATRRYNAGIYAFGEGLGVGDLRTPFTTTLTNGYGIAAIHLLDKTTNGSLLNTQFQLKPTSLTVSYVGPSAVPAPATWAMFVVGFAGTGACLRRKTGRRVLEPVSSRP